MTAPPSQDAARGACISAFEAARAAGDAGAMAAAALELAGLARFGLDPGRAPALLHEALESASGRPDLRVSLLAALARTWAYAYDAPRGRDFAAQAVALAEQSEDARLLADALEAQLTVAWGPDDLEQRVASSRRLADVAAHVDDVRTRQGAHLWRLTTALETIDPIAVARQLTGLDRLAGDSGDSTVRYFALTRRAMHALLTGDLSRCRELTAQAASVGAESGIPDAYAVQHCLVSELARQTGDHEALAAEAVVYAELATEYGIQSLMAEAAVLYAELGDLDRARRLLRQAVGSGLAAVPRDVDWMLTMTKAVDAAALLGEVELAREGIALLEPYVGRGALNGGAVLFVGVVEDVLHAAATLVGDPRADQWRTQALAAYDTLGADWLAARVRARSSGRPAQDSPAQGSDAATRRRLALRPMKGGALWSVGPVGAAQVLPDMRGLRHLHALLSRPGVDVAALDLAGGGGPVLDEPGAGELLDRQALASYRRRLADIDVELDEAREWADQARVERLEVERAALLHEVGAATGLHGRPRAGAGSAEKARVAVRKAITAALERIESVDPTTARVLRATTRTGSACRYDPDPDSPTDWEL